MCYEKDPLDILCLNLNKYPKLVCVWWPSIMSTNHRQASKRPWKACVYTMRSRPKQHPQHGVSNDSHVVCRKWQKMSIYDNWLGGYVYIKYATESPKTGDSNKHITCQHAGHLFKFKHNMSKRVIFVAHPSYIYMYSSTVVRWEGIK